ncbi:MAG: DNA mismatch repair endonuclease MutL [Oscillospiraceae bacterium]
MAQINVLDKHTAELIAAGEVVERPASVAKELCENAIDAKASNITLTIEHGGIKLIEVQDNGGGIESDYVPTAFLRHATSKVQTQEDLESISTLGFRGEALASIASVSKISLLTKTEIDEYACLYRIEGGEEISFEAAARPQGTTISVRDLFYNTPARMKFLKKDVSEGNYVSDVISHLALSHPEISFKFIREGKVQFQTPGDGRLLSAAYEVLTRDFSRELIDIDYTIGNYKLTGLVTPPHAVRASRAMQFFYINGRYVKNRTIMAALENAYRGIAMQGKFPGGILSLQMPTELVDVNVHPAKTEVRFARDSDVFDVVYQGVKSKLMQNMGMARELLKPQEQILSESNTVMQNSFTDEKSHINAINDSTSSIFISNIYSNVKKENTLASTAYVPYLHDDVMPQNAKLPIDAEPSPFENSAQDKSENENGERDSAEDAAYKESTVNRENKYGNIDIAYSKDDIIAEQQQMYKGEEETQNELQFVGEVFRTYIITQHNDELCFIDKHAAHERIIYEELFANYGDISSQQLLAAVTASLSAQEKNAIMENLDILQKSGIEIEDFGGTSVLIRAVPCDVVPEDIENLVVELASRLTLSRKDTIAEKTQWVLHSISCRAAIKGGDKTHEKQLLHLAQDILNGKVPPFCPHGRPIILKLTRKELEKQFGRQG